MGDELRCAKFIQEASAQDPFNCCIDVPRLNSVALNEIKELTTFTFAKHSLQSPYARNMLSLCWFKVELETMFKL